MKHLQKPIGRFAGLLEITVSQSDGVLHLRYENALLHALLVGLPLLVATFAIFLLVDSNIYLLMLGSFVGTTMFIYLQKKTFWTRVRVVGNQALIWGPHLRKQTPRIIPLNTVESFRHSKWDSLHLLIERSTGVSRFPIYDSGLTPCRPAPAIVGDYLLEHIDGVPRVAYTATP